MIDRTITYRLIGAGIMVLSAAVILPLVLDGERPAELDVQVQVTSPPAFPIIEIAPVKPADSLPIESNSTDNKAVGEIRLFLFHKQQKILKVSATLILRHLELIIAP